MGEPRWEAAIRQLDYYDGNPSYCITNGEVVIGEWWLTAPLLKARWEAWKMNRRRNRGLRTLDEVFESRRRTEKATAEEQRKVNLAMRLLERELADQRFEDGS